MGKIWFMAILAGLVVLPPATGQESKPTIEPTPKQVLQEWLKSDVPDKDLLAAAVDSIAEGGEKALLCLVEMLKAEEAGKNRKNLRALDSVVTHLGLRWLERVEKSEMVYAGQYHGLRSLRPYITDLYLGLLLDTPAWFPSTHRVQVVPALRDLYPEPPDGEDLARMEAIVLEEDREPPDLRARLSFALAQWGNRKFVRKDFERLNKVIAESKNVEELLIARRELAGIHYALRDYQSAAVVHANYLQQAAEVDHPLTPLDYYNAACCMSLSGDRKAAWGSLATCLDLIKSPSVDSSVKLKRQLFDRDPEIAAVRSMPGFAKLLDAAFAEQDSANEDPANEDSANAEGK